jgi:hypothetical protein
MIENFKNADWSQWYYLLSKGNPPLAFQLLIVNSIFFVIFMIRRMRGQSTMRARMANTIQAILIATNILIFYQDTVFPFYYHNISLVARRIMQVL